MRIKYLYFLLLLIFSIELKAQCDPTVPTFTVNLTGSPDSIWVSPPVVRDDGCCTSGNNDRCVKFVITLDAAAVGINFSVASGALPTGALFYQINCGPETPVGDPICLSGVGPHILTFCKPGNNENTYQIESIPPATGGTNVVINDGCIGTVSASGYNVSTMVWTSINPGTQGQYNSYLSCTTACTNPTVTGADGAPAFIDYKVCGQPEALCNFATTCDTVRVTFNPTLGVNIVPINPTICFGQTSTTITANGTGGTPPYSYLWNNINPSQTINVGVGTYNVQLSDASGCPPTFNSVTVTAFSVAISANAGANQTKCSQSPVTTLNGIVTGASGGIWSGGAGNYSPSNTSLTNMVYTPTAGEITSGGVNLFLTTTGNGTCPEKVDTVRINFLPFSGTITSNLTDVSCTGGSDGSAALSITGGNSPYTYSWNTVPAQTTATATSLAQGTYSVSITDGIGCVAQTTVTITQPTPIALASSVTNVSCFNGSNGSIAITPSGGTPGYTYSWAPGGQTGATAIGLTAGVYTVTVRDSKNCQTTGTYTVTQPPVLTSTVTPTNVSCFGGSNGSASSTVAGGTSPYTYNWSGSGSTSPNVSGLTAGNYTLTITDNLNCVVTATLAITQPTALLVSTTSTNETCDYLNNGTATAVVSGGTTPYTYSWAPGGQTTISISALASNTYTLTATDALGCNNTAFAIITEPTVLVANLSSQTNVSCFGGNNGAAAAAGSGGTPNYTYNWMPGNINGASATGLIAGTYTLTVTDNNTCTATNSVTITQPAAALTVTSTTINVSCSGGGNGSITAIPAGGTPNYSYLWNPNGQTSATASGLSSGTYTVNVTDNLGCTTSATYTVTEPLILATVLTPSNISCFGGSDGGITSAVSGGTSPYTYSWSAGGTNPTISGLPIGTYTLTVTDNLNCVLASTVTLTQPPVLFASTTPVNETCDYLNNGTATANASGGTLNYSYLWSSGGQTTATATGLISGTHTVTVTDGEGCVTTATAIITEPAPIAISFANQVNVSCFGGNNASISSVVSGGTPNYTYNWMPGASTGANASSLAAGTYTLTVTDANNCTANNTVTITEPLAPLTVTSTISNVSCTGGSNGSVTAIPAGGTAPYTYIWNPSGQTTITATGLTAGVYTVTVTDNLNCTTTGTYTVTEPLPLATTLTPSNISCFGGSDGGITSAVSGGTVPYTYLWSGAGGTNPDASGLPIGTYSLTVTDNLNCVLTTTITLTEPPVLFASTTPVNETCEYLNNGAATANVSGGTLNYSYLWAPSGQTTITASSLASGTHTVTVTDGEGCVTTATAIITEPLPLAITFGNQIDVSCFGGNDASVSSIVTGGTPNYSYNWMPGASTGDNVSSLAAGTYTLTITDANTCTANNTITITQPIAPLSVTASSTPTSCFEGTNGTATAVAAGGTSPYVSYVWNLGVYNGASVSGLEAGIYTVTTTDSKGCFATNTVEVIEPDPILPITSTNNSTCNLPNGQASVTVTGGAGGYTFLWSPGGQTTAVVSGLLAGPYTVVVTDANGCTQSQFANVNDNGGPQVSIVSVTHVSCYGGNDGTATAAVVGGTGLVTFSWAPTGGNALAATGLVAGEYTVSAVDANGCESYATTSPEITQPDSIIINVTTTDVLCFGGATGTASALAIGGTPNYTYTWLPSNATGTTTSGLAAGTFTVRVTDSKNCIEEETFLITQPTAALSVTASATPTSCFAGTDGTASSVASGGTSPYNYTWVPGSVSGQNISNLAQGTYTINVTDSKGCTATNNTTVNQPTIVVLTPSSVNSTCGASNGQAAVLAAGGTPNYSYLWTPVGGTNSTATGLITGTYSVQVTDDNGCIKNTSVTVSNTPGPIASIASTTNVSCNGGNDATATASVAGGTGTMDFAWAPSGGTAITATGLPIGIYTVTVTDDNGCQSQAITSQITQPTVLTVNVTTNNVSCFAGNNGTASAAAAGGTSAYSYVWLPTNTPGATISGLAAGTFTVRATDAEGCITDQTYTITQPTAALSVAASFTAVSCFGGDNGSTDALASGGTGPYTYTWMPGSILGQSLSNLSIGTYTVNVVDDNGCLANTNITVTQPTLALSATTDGDPTACFGGSDGIATVTPIGGTSGYTYLWTPSGITTQTATGLASGNYVVLVLDANGCETNASVSIGQPTEVSGTLIAVQPSCGLDNGSITGQISGGTGPYTYIWTPGGSTSSTLSGVGPGNYSLEVRDALNCVQTFTTSLTNIAGPSVVQSNTTLVSCNGGNDGTASVAVSQGTLPYTITWLPTGGNNDTAVGLFATTYTINVVDGLGCPATTTLSVSEPTPVNITIDSVTNASCLGSADGIIEVLASGGTPGYTYLWASPVDSTTASVSGLGAGTYTVNAFDANNCPHSISVSITEPTTLVTTVGSVVNPVCFNGPGSATVEANGGTPPYAYDWNTTPPQSGSTATNIPNGTYQIITTDANGCKDTTSATITQPTQIFTTAGINDTICLGSTASISASATGGSGGYYFAWQPSGSISAGTLNPSPTSNTSYVVIGYDVNGCSGNPDTVDVIVYSLSPSNIQAIGATPICPGASSTIYAVATGNTGPLTYSWNNNLGTGPGAFVVAPSQPTSYVVTVTGVCTIVVEDSVNVLFNAQPTIQISSDDDAVCAPGSIQFTDGSISGNLDDPITSWLWTFGDGTTSTDPNPSHAFNNVGTYNVTLSVSTDGGCTSNNASGPYTINAYPVPVAGFALSDNLLDLPYETLYCTNQSVGATIYSWNFGDGGSSTLPNPSYLYSAVGTFTIELTATNQYGCSDVETKSVVTDAQITFPNAFTPDPNGPTGGSYTIGDLTNDVFFPYTSGVTEYKLQIFNRWGELIFESLDIKQGWDGYYRGKLCPQDVYVWKAYLKLNNGKTFTQTGDVTLLQ